MRSVNRYGKLINREGAIIKALLARGMRSPNAERFLREAQAHCQTCAAAVHADEKPPQPVTMALERLHALRDRPLQRERARSAVKRSKMTSPGGHRRDRDRPLGPVPRHRVPQARAEAPEVRAAGRGSAPGPPAELARGPRGLPLTTVDAAAIERAVAEIDPVFRDSPQYVSEALGEEVGFRPLLKVETLNPVRCFKGRGGSVLAAQAAPGDVLACASAGNFGQGVAYGARAAGLRCVVYASGAAQPDKLARMRALGADVRLVAGDFDAAKDAAEAAAAEEGMRSIVDGREPEIALGAGTIARELTAWPEPIDAVVIPVGNGSLAWGMTTWLAAHAPETELIGVGPTGAPMMEHAWRTGSLESFGPTDTIADGLAARVPVAEAVHALRATLHRFVLVDDDRLRDAMALLADRCGVLTEPSGAAGLAGALVLRRELAGRTVAFPVTGSNV